MEGFHSTYKASKGLNYPTTFERVPDLTYLSFCDRHLGGQAQAIHVSMRKTSTVCPFGQSYKGVSRTKFYRKRGEEVYKANQKSTPYVGHIVVNILVFRFTSMS